MNIRKTRTNVNVKEPRRSTLSDPTASVAKHSAEAAPLIRWDKMSSPLGTLFIAMSRNGLCAVEFGRGEREFLQRLDPRTRLERSAAAVQPVMAQLDEYFAGDRSTFHVPVDLSALTPFQRGVLEAACRIAAGNVWSYGRLARELGKPRCSRPVGQALARNPIPIVIPCHRVIASDGSLGGYSGGSGLSAKRWLLHLEGALW